MNRREMVDLIIRYTKGSQVGHPKITTASAARYRIEAPNGGLVVHADGETVCIDGRSLDVECVPGALQIVCDPGRVERERSAATQGKASKGSPP
jgi:diacylglycerol kinase family enzyme